MTALTRGPLSARVYWTRRAMVFGTAVLLVFGIARLLNGGSDGSSAPEPQAVQAGADTTTAATPNPSLPPPAVASTAEKTKKPKPEKSTEPALAAPTGECADEDIAATPEVRKAEAGGPIRIVVGLRTIESEACTWRVTPETLTMKITSGKDDIWSSRQCPRAIPKRDVVVRREATLNLWVYWSARRSDDECSKQTSWAMPGWYHVAVSALAGEPSDVQFELVRPKAEVVTETADPDGGKSGDQGAQQDHQDADDGGNSNGRGNGGNGNKPKHR
jgi:hypothetical protein